MVSTEDEHVVTLKQLSIHNWQFEFDHCEDVLESVIVEKFKLEVRDGPAGKNNKNKNSGKTLVAVFLEEPDNELIAEMRWKIHTRYN